MEKKRLLRTNILEYRKIFVRREMYHKDKAISETLKSIIISLSDKKQTKIGIYIPLDGEPDVTNLFHDKCFAKTEYEFFAPKIQYSVLNFVKLLENDLKERKDTNKLIQPKSNKITIPEIIIVPGLAFSYTGYRLGFGNGYYDRYIDKNGENNFSKIGVCYHRDLYKYIPNQNHDKKMDYIVTEQIIISL
ncbi:MAG: 5-formyltetrahydrofolate cyclo-ligase [Rickettsiaceae bacterium]|nr:5-formyltetrahydrofolate cyclo-ligase [Rickettsiaceae bacterium]